MNVCFGITITSLIFIIGLSMVQCFPMTNQSAYECLSTSDCGLGECCVIGMMRYSTPQCLPMGQIEDFCREDNDPDNHTLYYPSGVNVEVYDVYTHVCPCDSGLQCEDNSCIQTDNYDNNNYLY